MKQKYTILLNNYISISESIVDRSVSYKNNVSTLTSYVALVVGAAGTGYAVYKGERDAKQKRDAAKELNAKTVRPIYNKQKEIDDVYNLAESEINDTGLQDYTNQRLGESEANGIDAILKSGGKADFSTIQGAYGSQLGEMLQRLKANRANNIAAFNNAAYAKGKASDTEFQYNQDAPYKDARQLSALLQTQAAEASANATNNLISGVSNLGIMSLKAKDQKLQMDQFNFNKAHSGGAQVNPVAGSTSSVNLLPPANSTQSANSTILKPTETDFNNGQTPKNKSDEEFDDYFKKWMKTQSPNLERI